jgi:aminoglycoside 6'-N-acetyltransferase I
MIYLASPADAAVITPLAHKLWGHHDADELATEFRELLTKKDAAVFLCVLEGHAVGFAQCQLRHDYVEGTSSSPVGYLEGVFVEENYRKQGYGKQLISVCQAWAKERGCTEFASDCELTSAESLAFHLASGFEEANRIICFVKNI